MMNSKLYGGSDHDLIKLGTEENNEKPISRG
jgi:hypothetical protein